MARRWSGVGSVSQSKAGASGAALGAAAAAAARGEVRQQGGEAVQRQAVGGRPARLLAADGRARRGGGHGVALGDGGVEVLVLEQQRRERLAQVRWRMGRTRRSTVLRQRKARSTRARFL